MSKAENIGGPPLTLAAIDLQSLENDIAGGAFPHVAAGAHGIPNSTHWRYLKVGREALEKLNGGAQLNENEIQYLNYFKSIERAHLRARALAEGRVFVDKPEMWLRYGPGRDKGPENPGWTETVRVEKRTVNEISLSSDTAALLGRIVDTFNEGPETRVIEAPETQNAEFSRGSTALRALSGSEGDKKGDV